MLNGGVIALPPILNYGTPDLQAQYVPDILAGKKYIALAITEAFAGSDVAGIQTTAVREGDVWIVTGTKKYVLLLLIRQDADGYRWITNGTFSDYFTTLCQTNVCHIIPLILTCVFNTRCVVIGWAHCSSYSSFVYCVHKAREDILLGNCRHRLCHLLWYPCSSVAHFGWRWTRSTCHFIQL